jgi:hypothetical protein
MRGRCVCEVGAYARSVCVRGRCVCEVGVCARSVWFLLLAFASKVHLPGFLLPNYSTCRLWVDVSCSCVHMSTGVGHNHLFQSTPSPIRRFCRLVIERGNMSITSGVTGVKLMKTTQSGFKGFIEDEYVTATSLLA